jgi:hypothetical protein
VVQDPGARFKRELRAFGYVEGKNIAIEYRSTEGKRHRLPALANELVRLKVDVLVMSSTIAALAAKNATRTIPIIFYTVTDPVAAGLARPGGNITGITDIGAVLSGKRSYSRKPFPSSPAWQCCGIHRILAMRNNGKKPTAGTRTGLADFIPWRVSSADKYRARSKRQLRRVAPLLQ